MIRCDLATLYGLSVGAKPLREVTARGAIVFADQAVALELITRQEQLAST